MRHPNEGALRRLLDELPGLAASTPPAASAASASCALIDAAQLSP